MLDTILFLGMCAALLAAIWAWIELVRKWYVRNTNDN